MFDKLSSMFDKTKDKMIATAMIAVVNKHLGEAGEMVSCDVNTKDKTIKGEFDLKGESEVVIVEGKYEIQQENDGYYLVLKDLVTSKEWVNILAKNYLKEKKFPLPDKYQDIIVKFV